MRRSASDRLGTERRKKTRRISILNNATAPTLTLPTPQNPLWEGRWV